MLASLDLHDVLALIDGRPELAAEFASADPQVMSFVVAELTALRDMPSYDYLLQSVTSGYGTVATDRAELLRQRVAALIALCDDHTAIRGRAGLRAEVTVIDERCRLIKGRRGHRLSAQGKCLS